ncbi:tRNA (adenine22-N1)-methyltransferase [Pseudobutyrivibrio sp. C4]|uniref:tRNA (adenine(22)-N(1))-methyltransferase n=1 Tax=Pseudobutyrivibrio sp. C4 TaxID=1520803 RepID=UPI0008C73608|nr:class I SAM-dependent methyltransferase [Pseudobutyrivibrio sp. C4]SET06911.1 tRNA (adenine22-N1)-methyltransferase [Pseudobutyrivibrio sp. C4]
MIKLSPRLQIIYDMVPKCGTVADVGCDHGYLTISLLENHIVNKAIAMDVNKGPLESAKVNVGQANLLNQVSFRLSDGLAKLDEAEADVICICGMGGALIKRILDARLMVAKSAKALILEPQSEYKALREYLVDNGFQFLDESLCTEEGKIYPIMKVTFSGEHTELSDAELEYGPIIIEKSPDLLQSLLEKNKREYTSILNKLESLQGEEVTDPIQHRKAILLNELELIKQVELKRRKSHG